MPGLMRKDWMMSYCRGMERFHCTNSCCVGLVTMSGLSCCQSSASRQVLKTVVLLSGNIKAVALSLVLHVRSLFGQNVSKGSALIFASSHKKYYICLVLFNIKLRLHRSCYFSHINFLSKIWPVAFWRPEMYGIQTNLQRKPKAFV